MIHPTVLSSKGLRNLSRHDMKSIIAETERDASSQTPPKDGLPTLKWTPRTPPRPERMPPAPGFPTSLSPGKKVDLRGTTVITPGSPTIARPDTKSSGLSMTRPRGVGSALVEAKQQAQSPPKTLMPKPSAHIPPPPIRTQNTQIFQSITPVKPVASSSSMRRTSLVSSLDRYFLMLIFIDPGVAASHGRTCQTIPSPTDNHPKVV